MDIDYRYSTDWVPQYLRRLLKCWRWSHCNCARPAKRCWTVFNDKTGEGIMVLGTGSQRKAQQEMKRFAIGYGKIRDARIANVRNLSRVRDSTS